MDNILALINDNFFPEVQQFPKEICEYGSITLHVMETKP